MTPRLAPSLNWAGRKSPPPARIRRSALIRTAQQQSDNDSDSSFPAYCIRQRLCRRHAHSEPVCQICARITLCKELIEAQEGNLQMLCDSARGSPTD